MADAVDPEAAAARLEAALLRIAALSAVRPAAPRDPTAEVAARLDALISQLRKLLQNLDG